MFCVVAGTVARCAAEVEVGADYESEGCRVGAVEHSSPSVHIAIAGVLHGVVSELITIAWAQLQVEERGAIGDTGSNVQVKTYAAVVVAIAESFSLRQARKDVAGKVPCLAGAEWEAEHVHCHGVPHAVDISVGGCLSTGDGVVGDGGDDAVLLHVDVKHCHDAALRVLVEVAESQVHAVGEGGFQLRVTNDDVQWVALVGNGLQLCNAGLATAQAIVECQVAGLAKLVAEACEWCHAPSPSRRDVASAV